MLGPAGTFKFVRLQSRGALAGLFDLSWLWFLNLTGELVLGRGNFRLLGHDGFDLFWRQRPLGGLNLLGRLYLLRLLRIMPGMIRRRRYTAGKQDGACRRNGKLSFAHDVFLLLGAVL